MGLFAIPISQLGPRHPARSRLATRFNACQAVNVEVVEDDFEGADPSVAMTNYRVHVDCMGPAVIRSYAILTRTTDGADAVVAYYGVPQPV
jgi:MspA